MSKKDEALKLALDDLESIREILKRHEANYSNIDKAITAIKEAHAERPAQDNTYSYAKNLAEAIFKQHFANDEHYASGRIVWGVNDTVIGILTQIDNMVAGMVRRPAQQQEPVAWRWKMSLIPDAWQLSDQPHPEAALKEPLYTSPQPAQPSKPLTDEEIHKMTVLMGINPEWKAEMEIVRSVVRNLEAKLWEKNA